jgi:hypothetical protein
LKENLRAKFNHNLDPEVRLNPETHNINVPLLTSLMPQVTKIKHKQKFNLSVKKKKGDLEPMPSTTSNPNPEATTGEQSEIVKTMTPKHLVSKKPEHS